MPKLTLQEIEHFNVNVLSKPERDAIIAALSSVSPWDHDKFDSATKSNLVSVKEKLKDFHLLRTNYKCCYCRRSLLDATIETDREHIVPKGKVKLLSYELFNLSVACKRCNMTYKGETVEHLVDFDTISSDLFNSDRYKIPHPNIDTYEDHLVKLSFQWGSREFTSYRKKTPKGKFLFELVELRKLCVAQFDLAQAGRSVSERLGKLLKFPTKGV